jgi:hypothetical protein
VVKITIGGGSELEGSETDIIESFIVDTHDFVSVLNQLMDRQCGVIWLYDSIRYLR